MKTVGRSAVLLVVLITLSALPDASQVSHSHSDTREADPQWTELLRSMEKMHVAMASVGRSGDGGMDFVRLMLPHHQAAIDMAKTELLYGKDMQLRRLAQEIITDQQSEIELMQLWLKQHESSPPKSKADAHL